MINWRFVVLNGEDVPSHQHIPPSNHWLMITICTNPGNRTSIMILYFNIAMENGPLVYGLPIKHGDLP